MKPALEQIEQTIRTAEDLPTLSPVAAKLTRLLRTPYASAAEVGRMISEDPALTARVLRVVNSAYYGFPQQIHSIPHATVILGFNKIRDIVMTASAVDSFRGRTGSFDFTGFWKHSITAAVACDALARALHLPAAEDAFVSGLLHDIGKLVLAVYASEEYGKALRYVRERNVLLREAEEEILGFHHATVGGRLAARWSFPPGLCEAIEFHHAPAKAREPELASLAHVADILARTTLVGSGGDRRLPALDESARRDLRLGRDVLDHALDETFTGLKQGRAFFDLIQPHAEAAR